MLIKIPPDIGVRKCDSCAIILNNEDLYYHCRTEIIADKGQTPLELHYPDQLIAQALFELDSRGEQDILDDIYQEIILLLCPKCCKILRQQLRNMMNKCNNCTNKQADSQSGKKGKLLQFYTPKKPCPTG